MEERLIGVVNLDGTYYVIAIAMVVSILICYKKKSYKGMLLTLVSGAFLYAFACNMFKYFN